MAGVASLAPSSAFENEGLDSQFDPDERTDDGSGGKVISGEFVIPILDAAEVVSLLCRRG